MRYKKRDEEFISFTIRVYKSDLQNFDRACEGRPRATVIRKLIEMYTKKRVDIEW